MVRRESEMRSESLSGMRGGNGIVDVIHIMEQKEFREKGRLYAKNILKPGTSIGQHEHKGDFEVYFVIKGEGVFYDNGKPVSVKAGDVGIIENGQSHGIENTGTENMEIIALVLFD